MKISKTLVLQGITGGSLGLGILSIIVGMVAFNGESFQHDDKMGIELGMQIDATSAEIFVWIRAPRPLYIKTSIANIKKIEDGETKDGGLTDLFPIGATTYGAGEINFEIMAAEEEQMPDLRNRSQGLVPMAYIKKASNFPTPVRYVMLIGSMALNNWTLVKFGILASALGMIGLGVGLRFMNKKAGSDMVEDLKDSVS